MAHSLKLTVAAEGVETLEQLQFLRLLKCDRMQGYFVSRPVPADDFTEMLHESWANDSRLAA
jgi:EAL domain-containing protein (putative c-di-GMP-specific phosphodiesterase class I)